MVVDCDHSGEGIGGGGKGWLRVEVILRWVGVVGVEGDGCRSTGECCRSAGLGHGAWH